MTKYDDDGRMIVWVRFVIDPTVFPNEDAARRRIVDAVADAHIVPPGKGLGAHIEGATNEVLATYMLYDYPPEWETVELEPSRPQGCLGAIIDWLRG